MLADITQRDHGWYCLTYNCIFQIINSEHVIFKIIIKARFYMDLSYLTIFAHYKTLGGRYVFNKYLLSQWFWIILLLSLSLCRGLGGQACREVTHGMEVQRGITTLPSSQERWRGGLTATLHEIPAFTYLTPAEKLTTGKKSPSVLKFSNIPCTGCPLMRKEMLGTPRSRQQLTTSSDLRRCWLMEATALGMRPGEQGTRRCVGLWRRHSQATHGRWGGISAFKTQLGSPPLRWAIRKDFLSL